MKNGGEWRMQNGEWKMENGRFLRWGKLEIGKHRMYRFLRIIRFAFLVGSFGCLLDPMGLGRVDGDPMVRGTRIRATWECVSSRPLHFPMIVGQLHEYIIETNKEA
ncbi:hypothetical protein JHK85_000966 [Glycine max]|nr:hypothetical protein JHK85_000966 [Glycine max]